MTQDATIPHRPTTQQIVDAARELAQQLAALPPHEAAPVLAAFLATLQPRTVTVDVTAE